jgi:septal ring factor EnvC (AmiA/AmiB activator)
MDKQTVNVKSNGLRNELKEIRKSIDSLTNALIEIHIAQTNKHYEKNINCTCGNSRKLRKSKHNDG